MSKNLFDTKKLEISPIFTDKLIEFSMFEDAVIFRLISNKKRCLYHIFRQRPHQLDYISVLIANIDNKDIISMEIKYNANDDGRYYFNLSDELRYWNSPKRLINHSQKSTLIDTLGLTHFILDPKTQNNRNKKIIGLKPEILKMINQHLPNSLFRIHKNKGLTLVPCQFDRPNTKIVFFG
ncbi:TPA: hypothetical protein ACTXXA_003503 [Legionella anisa]